MNQSYSQKSNNLPIKCEEKNLSGNRVDASIDPRCNDADSNKTNYLKVFLSLGFGQQLLLLCPAILSLLGIWAVTKTFGIYGFVAGLIVTPFIFALAGIAVFWVFFLIVFILIR